MMRILYIARHDAGGNEDEKAITHALTELGHTVDCVHEKQAHKPQRPADMCLFHKWHDANTLTKIRCPKVFWYFDLVDFPDPTIQTRCESRKAWMRDVIPHVDIGFCTDGDWVNRDTSGKLVWLTQGADTRKMGRGKATSTTRVLFTGIGQRGGEKRASFVEEMRRQYGHKFLHIQGGIHGRELADKIAGANVVLAPDAPVTDHYWSNRVYLSLGFGAFMLHPWCERLTHHYAPAKDIVYYRNRDELHGKIEYYLARPKERERIAASGLERTKAEHTYLARCKELLRVVAERL